MRVRSVSGFRVIACVVPLSLALAQPASGALSSTGPGRDAGAAKAGASTGALPAGHPPVDDDGDESDSGEAELPAGHPAVAPAAKAPAENTLPEDTSELDNALPPGTIAVEVRDAQDRPVPRADVNLGILQQSVAKGESRRHTTMRGDETGLARFEGLEPGGGVAYRITIPWGSGSELATYAAMPFQLDLHHGQRVRLHVYPVTSQVDAAYLGIQGIVYIELKDDVLQFDELFQVYNLGAVTWVPSDVVLALPAGWKAFSAQKEMSDTGFDEVAGQGARMRGTFSPGQHSTHFRYQVPYNGDESAELSLSLPPRVARMRVIAEAAKGMTLRVNDFPPAQPDRNQQGQRVLLTERQLRSGDKPLSRVRVVLENIPTEGPAKWIAVVASDLTMGIGLFVAFEQEKNKGKKSPHGQDAERARSRLVAEIASLDKAHRAGQLGPKAYNRIREALIDSLARIMAVRDA